MSSSKSLHFNARYIQRSKGLSAIAAVAYFTATRMFDSISKERGYEGGKDRNYKYDWRKKDDVVCQNILAPENSPSWVFEKAGLKLWTSAEASEKRKDSTTAREFVIALPRFLSDEQQIGLAEEFINDNFVSMGMVTQYAFHNSKAADGQENPHLHILTTVREIDNSTGLFKKSKTGVRGTWESKKTFMGWRANYAKVCNKHLQASGLLANIDLRSYKDQGIDKIPAEHLGRKACELEKHKIDIIARSHNHGVSSINIAKTHGLVSSINQTDINDNTINEVDIIQLGRQQYLLDKEKGESLARKNKEVRGALNNLKSFIFHPIQKIKKAQKIIFKKFRDLVSPKIGETKKDDFIPDVTKPNEEIKQDDGAIDTFNAFVQSEARSTAHIDHQQLFSSYDDLYAASMGDMQTRQQSLEDEAHFSYDVNGTETTDGEKHER